MIRSTRKGADKGQGGGQSKCKGQGNYQKWQGDARPKGGTENHPYCPEFLQKDSKTGRAYCRKYNHGVDHDKKACHYLDECSWFVCKNRKNCNAEKQKG